MKSIDEYIDIIKRNYPDVDIQTVNMITSGYDNVCVVINDETVFRFSKSEEHRFAKEYKLLELLKGCRDVRLPHYMPLEKDARFVQYRYIPGYELTTTRWNELTDSQKEHITESLGNFLKILHQEASDQIDAGDVDDEKSFELFLQLKESIRLLVYPQLDNHEKKFVEAFFRVFYSHCVCCDAVTIIHGDLSPEHLIWDSVTNTLGIIDFSDFCKGDPARDFAGLWYFGETFVRAVIAQYGFSARESLLFRSKLYFMRIPLFLMIDAIRGYPVDYNDAILLFKKIYNNKQFKEVLYG